MKKLLLDIEKCYKCLSKNKKCTAKCSYFYHQSDILKVPIENNGIEKLLAYAAQYIICRRCEEKFCVTACPNDALEKNDKGILQRYSMRCTSCKTCSVACPFGTIYPEILPYKTSKCDFCLGRTNGKQPLCVETCPEKALEYIEVEESPEKNIYVIKDRVAIHGLPWNKEAKVGAPK
ncbi:MAG: 4Fe-4S dicluster domain-containing protein [Endomicrobiia bacterium]